MRAKTLVQPHEWTAFLLRRVAVHIYHLTTANLLKSRTPIITGVTPIIACLTSETQQNRLYDVLPYHFHEERTEAGEYLPLRRRRPSVRYPLCRIVVEDSVSLLFSEGHFPTIDCADRAMHNSLASIVRDSHLNLVMTEAAIRGSVGSVAILMRVLDGRIF